MKQNRRTFIKNSLKSGCALAATSCLAPRSFADAGSGQSYKRGETISLFDGETLKNWRAIPRNIVPRRPGEERKVSAEKIKQITEGKAKWWVEDGMIVGSQNPPDSGIGGYLLSEDTYGDFELEIDTRGDWGADTGVLVRGSDLGSQAYQVLVDHRENGCIGGVYGNGLGPFHGKHFDLKGEVGEDGKLTKLRAQLPEDEAYYNQLKYRSTPEEFLKAWKINEWNTIKIRCVGKYPYITTWVNGTKMVEFDGATYQHERYDREGIYQLLGRKGHIAVEVHPNGKGNTHWQPNLQVRWKNIKITPLLPV